MKNIKDTFLLYNRVEIPCMGFGTYKAADGRSAEILSRAIEAGYRSFDMASFYQTEAFMGEAYSNSGLAREEFFFISKVWKTEMGYAKTRNAFEESLRNLRTDYLDLFLIHWPLPSADHKDWKNTDLDTWRALEELYEEGRVRAIGVSNFLPHHLDNLMQHARIRPMVDQIEFHPGHTQEATVAYCRENQIKVQAWSPIGRGRVLEDELIVELAQKYGASPAQISLRFALQSEVIPFPKASSPERMRENMDVFGFELSQEDMYRILTMPPTGWSGYHPDRE